MSADWLSNLTSDVKTYLNGDKIGSFRTPSQSNNRIRLSSPSVPQANFSDRIQNGFKNSFVKFRQAKQNADNRLKLKVADLVKSFDADKNQPGTQLLVKGGIRGGINRIKTAFKNDPLQYSFTRPIMQARPNLKAAGDVKFRENGPTIKEAIDLTAPTVAKDFRKAVTGADASIIQNSPVLKKIAGLSGDTAQTFGSGEVDAVQGLESLFGYGNSTLDKVSGLAQTVRGASKIASPTTKIFQAATLLSQLPSNVGYNLLQRLSVGALRGQTGIKNLAPDVKLQKIKIPFIGDVDPVETVGNMIGFTQGPMQKQIFEQSSKLLPSAGGFLKWVTTTGSRGAAQNLILSLPELKDQENKAKYMLKEMGSGAISELIGQGLIEGTSKSFNFIKDSAASEFLKTQFAHLYDGAKDFKRKMSIPVKTLEQDPKTGEFITKPMWKVLFREQAGAVGSEGSDLVKGIVKEGDIVDPKTGKIVSSELHPKPENVAQPEDVVNTTTTEQAVNQKNIPVEDPQLPSNLKKAKPRYNYGRKAFIPEFESDLDKALYITAQTKKSVNDGAYRQFLKDNGFTDELIDSAGAQVRANIKAQAKVLPGGSYKDPQKIVVNTAESIRPAISQPETATDILKQQMKQQMEAPKPKPEQPQIDKKMAEEVNNRLFGKDAVKSEDVLATNTTTAEEGINKKDIPVKNLQLRKTYTSMMNSDSVSNEYKDQYLKDRPDKFYNVKENKESLDQAFKNIENEGKDRMLSRIMENGIDINDPQNMADAVVLHKILENEGNREGASALFGQLLDKATKSGESAQMTALIDKMGPSAMVESANDFIDGSVDKRNNGVLGKIFDKLGVTSGPLAEFGNSKEQAGKLLDGINQQFKNVTDSGERKKIVDDLIKNNPLLKRKIKNRGSFIDRIVKLAENPQPDSLFDLSQHTDITDALMKELHIPHMDKEFADHIWNTAAKIQRMKVGDAKDKATRELIKEINMKVPPTLKELHRAYRYNNVLSGLGTHLRNVWENIAKVVVYQPRLIAADELTQGHVLRAVAEPIRFYKSLINNFSKGTEGFKKAMNGEIYPEKFSLEGERPEILHNYLQITGKLLEAEDQFFSKPLEAALEEMKTGNGVGKAQAAKEAKIESDEILYKGGYDPENKTGQGTLLSAIDEIAIGVETAVRKMPFGDRIVMFPRIATKMLKAGFEYSLVGYLTTAEHRNPKIQNIKATIGVMAFMNGFYKAATGKARGQAPDNKKAKEAFYAEGPAWTIDLYGYNVPVRYFGPTALSTKMGILTYNFFFKNPKLATESMVKKVMYTVMGIASLAADETYTQGIQNVLDALSNIETGDTYALDKFVGQNLEQEIPFSGFQAWLNEFIDPVKRKGGTILETATRRMPILSQGSKSYTTPKGEPATSDYEVPGLHIRNNFLPYDITPVKPEYRATVNQTLESQKNKAIEKNKEKALEPGYWDRLMGTQASGDLGSSDISNIPTIKTSDQINNNESQSQKEGGFLSSIFGKKDKKIEKVYNPGDLVADSSNDVMDVRAITGGRTIKIPKDQKAFNEKYKDIAKIVNDYEKKKNDIIFDDSMPSYKQKTELKKLDDKFGFASEAENILQKNYPEQVLAAQIKTYGKGSSAGIENRGEWAVKSLSKLERGSDKWKDAVNKMWEGGVLTGKSTGTLAYILNAYPGLSKSDFLYTGKNSKLQKSVRSALSSGSKKNKSIVRAKAPSFSQSSSPLVSLKIPKISVPNLMQLKSTVPQAPDTSFLRVKAPDINSRVPKFAPHLLKVKGL